MNIKKTVCLLLAGTLFAGSMTQPVKAETISSAQQKAQQLEQQKQKAQQEQSSLNAQLNKIAADLKKAQEDVDAKEAEISKAEDELTEARIKENDQYERMKIRIRYMYEKGNTDMLAILLTAEDMADFLNKAEYVEQISTYDRQMLVEFQKAVEEVAAREAKLKSDKEKLLQLQNTLNAKQSEVEQLLASKKTEITNLNAEIGENARILNELIARAREAERRRKEAEAAERAAAARAAAEAAAKKKQNSGGGHNSGGGNSGSVSVTPPVVSGNGQLSNPCPGGHVTSEFGPRRAPTAGASTYHRGRDYGAGTGTPVYAADGGTVVTSSYSSARGNYIVINHGNGIQTWYQHLSAKYVSSGKVSRGQNIGAVGATGISSGPHLHFEVHVGGTPVDPRKYL